MMKIALSAAAILMSIAAAAHAEPLKAFKLTIGEQTIDIDAGESVEVTLPDGSKATASLQRNDFATYAGGTFSFNHPSAYNVARSDVGDNIVQHLMASALGTLVIVQEYSSLNPSTLTELMMQELTKETVGAGGTRSDEPVEHMLGGGEAFKGIRATVTYSGDTSFYEVLTYGAQNSGIVAVTRIDEERTSTEGVMLSTFWETLDLK
jgi:hypothetical protein